MDDPTDPPDLSDLAKQAAAAAARGGPILVFDWDEAARAIRAAGATRARAGLRGAWGPTGRDILRDGVPVLLAWGEGHLVSRWATPELEIGGARRPCFVELADRPEWAAEASWPASALAILDGREP